MKMEELREGQRVRMVPSREWAPPARLLGREGRVLERDGSTVLVELDGPAGGDGRGGETYAAFPSELEPAIGAAPPAPYSASPSLQAREAIPVLDASRGPVAASESEIAAVVISRSPQGAKS